MVAVPQVPTPRPVLLHAAGVQAQRSLGVRVGEEHVCEQGAVAGLPARETRSLIQNA